MQSTVDPQRNHIGIGAQRDDAGGAIDFHRAAGGGHTVLRKHHHRLPCPHRTHQALDCGATGIPRFDAIRETPHQGADAMPGKRPRQHDQRRAGQEHCNQQGIEQGIVAGQHQRPASQQCIDMTVHAHPEHEAQQQLQSGAQHRQ
jgi:hypothetical protein